MFIHLHGPLDLMYRISERFIYCLMEPFIDSTLYLLCLLSCKAVNCHTIHLVEHAFFCISYYVLQHQLLKGGGGDTATWPANNEHKLGDISWPCQLSTTKSLELIRVHLILLAPSLGWVNRWKCFTLLFRSVMRSLSNCQPLLILHLGQYISKHGELTLKV